ncbi:MAG: TPM domain-containing protein, partial [Leptolyngbyaceae cyanobacterium bins.59]|nr:TPM domain-containing protein [Leptolyngbyaceae cyanobacterium bins.59]
MVTIASLVLAFFVWAVPSVAYAYNNPDLLPDRPTNIIDLARALTDIQEARLDEHLSQFETETGWKLRVLTQFDR